MNIKKIKHTLENSNLLIDNEKDFVIFINIIEKLNYNHYLDYPPYHFPTYINHDKSNNEFNFYENSLKELNFKYIIPIFNNYMRKEKIKRLIK